MDFAMKMDYIMRTGGRNGGQAGLLRQLTTGNLYVDTVVAAIIPVVMHVVMPKSRLTGYMWLDVVILASIPVVKSKAGRIKKTIRSNLSEFYNRATDHFETTIEFEKESVVGWYFDDNDGAHDEAGKRNNILQRAVLLYIGHLKIKYHRSLSLLSAIKETGSKEAVGPRWARKTMYGGTSEQLAAYKINTSPPRDTWILVDPKKNIFFKQRKTTMTPGGREVSGSADDRKIKTTIHYTFWCKGANGNEVIQDFIDRAFSWYRDEMRATEDNSRYMYTLVAEAEPSKKPPRSGMGAEDKASKKDPQQTIIKYKRYKLGDAKDFESLFFPEKDNLLKILDYFEHKTGKYAVKGYPHKLGLLLHGPPGTGKTSLIKALACHTARHIVSVPLGRIKTNQDLMNIMFDQSFSVQKEEFPVQLQFENIIFVFEDVDAATPIVRRRPYSAETRKKKSRRMTAGGGRERSHYSVKRTRDNNKSGCNNGSGVSEVVLSTEVASPASTPAAMTDAPTVASPPTRTSTPTVTTSAPINHTAPGEGGDDKNDSPGDACSSSRSTPTSVCTLESFVQVPSLPGGEMETGSNSNHEERQRAVEPGTADEAGQDAKPSETEISMSSVPKGNNNNDKQAAELVSTGGDAGTAKNSSDTEKLSKGNNGEKRAAEPATVRKDNEVDERRYSSYESRSEEEESDTASSSSEEDESGLENEANGEAGGGGQRRRRKKKYASKYDKLDLAGLLNVLDGVVDTPGRIVVMTTNHVETLDPALIRPGRIDKRIRLGYMQYPAALEMTRHFFQTDLTSEQQVRLAAIFDEDIGVAQRRLFDRSRDHGRVTPAVIEQMAGEYDTVDEFLEGLEALPVMLRDQLERRERG